MIAEYEIVESFQITGRVVGVVIAQVMERSVGKPQRVEVLTPEGT